MTCDLPDFYPSPVDLPFNRASLAEHFQLQSPDQDPGGPGVWLLLQGNQVWTWDSAELPALPAGQQPLQAQHPPLYLGSWEGSPCRLLSVSKGEVIEGLTPHSLLANEPQLPLSLLSLAGVGGMILHWERVSRFCGNCGTPMNRLPREWGKECPDCKNHHFPRIHPCVIGLVVRGDEILLVRKPEWISGRFGSVRVKHAPSFLLTTAMLP